MPNRVPVVGCTEARHSSMSTSLSSGGISRQIIFLTGSATYTTHSFTDENCGGDIKVVKAYGKFPV